MSEYTVTKAREYEKDNIGKVTADERPEFHVTGQVGWVNDPNGFSVYKGEYHLFFQYHPYSTFWGPMHWGHVKSKDFIKWEFLPCAIAPDKDYDDKGCFSGSAIELDDGKQLLIYTGVSKGFIDDKEADLQQQCIAIGDGLNYEKCSINPVIPTEMIPEGGSGVDFRDPKIWKEEGRYFLAVGNRPSDGSGSILLYESEDAKSWSYKSVIDKCENRYGKMWECPDFFRLDGKKVLLVSPQDMEAEGYEFHSGNGTVVLLGREDSENRFIRESASSIDYGLDFYAPQTLLTPDGRRVMIAWMQNWDTCNQNHDERHIFGQMTVPRELTIKDNRLCQWPVRELENYRSDVVMRTIDKGIMNVSFDDICGRIFDMEIDIAGEGNKEGEECIIRLAKSDKYETVVRVDLQNETMSFDRSASGGRRDIVSARTCKINLKNGKVSLRILMDHHGTEVFVNHGECAMSSMIYTPMDADKIEFTTSQSVKAEVKFYRVTV